MKDVAGVMRKAYYNRISSLIYNGERVRVISNISSTQPLSPYVVISSQTATQMDEKNGFQYLASVLLDVVGVFDLNTSEIVVDSLVDVILQEIIPDETGNYIDLKPYFQVITTKLTSDNNLAEGTDANVIYRRLLRIEHKIEQL